MIKVMNSVEIRKEDKGIGGTLSDKGLSCNREAWRRDTMVTRYM